MTPIHLVDVVKAFGATRAVDNISLDIDAGQLFFLLGPSGCGKTTLLRMIAGFTEPTAGVIRFGDDDVTSLPPHRRDTGMVFQGYALWPHMTVRQNVAFGLEVRKVPKAERNRRVDEALAGVQLDAQADRRTNQLSGGQQQRVALARALVVRPRVLLLDEPLSNLDAKLRLDMRQSIRDICKASGITGIYVTHDQKEALSMADGIAVLSAGRLMQVGPPRQLYERPANRFVADFLGETNFIPATVTARDGDTLSLDTPLGPLQSTAHPESTPAGSTVTVSVRPESIRLHTAPAAGPNTFDAAHRRTIYLGEVAQHQADCNGIPLRIYELNPRLAIAEAQTLHAGIDPDDVVVLAE